MGVSRYEQYITGSSPELWPLLAPNGSAAAPSYSFANATGDGLYYVTNVGSYWESDGPYATINVQGATTFPLSTLQVGRTGSNAMFTFRAYNSATIYSNVSALADGASTYTLLRSKNGADQTDLNVFPTYVDVDTDLKTGGFFVGERAETATYNVASGDTLVEMDASGGARTVNLPAAASNSGRMLFVKKIDSSANAVTVDGNASETIDGATTQDIFLQYECLQLLCNGTGWSVV